MANHKRRRPKSRRAGCLFCKPHKRQGCKRSKGMLRRRDLRERVNEKEQRRECDRLRA